MPFPRHCKSLARSIRIEGYRDTSRIALQLGYLTGVYARP